MKTTKTNAWKQLLIRTTPFRRSNCNCFTRLPPFPHWSPPVLCNLRAESRPSREFKMFYRGWCPPPPPRENITKTIRPECFYVIFGGGFSKIMQLTRNWFPRIILHNWRLQRLRTLPCWATQNLHNSWENKSQRILLRNWLRVRQTVAITPNIIPLDFFAYVFFEGLAQMVQEQNRPLVQ